jgi:sialate O-acetylesterase
VKPHQLLARPRAGLLTVGLVAALTASPAHADVKVPSIFSSHMVLQQKQRNKVWGTASPNEDITVTLGLKSKTTKADGAGRWSLVLDPLAATSTPQVMTIKGENTITLNDILVGEVWICSGQSNMQWDVVVANDADLELLTATDPLLRLITVPLLGTQEPNDDFRGNWALCTPASATHFSAVGYFFGRQLRQTLGVPVGLIDNAWGGSACEAWIRRDLLENDPKYKPMIERWEAIEKQKSNRAQLTGNARPGNIYNGTLKPTIGYGIKGVIWYQGETNAGRAYQYRELFPLMIKSWRDEWGIGDFSFYWVQLADFLSEKAEPSDSAWAELREAQTMTMAKLPNTGQAVIIDLGEGKDIHPRNKQGVAKRLARWALARDYGLKLPYQSPTYKSMTVKDGKVTLTFDSVGNGLKTFDVAEARGFTIAGEDRKFYRAKAKIVGQHHDQVEVSADEVSKPVAVRYAWADNPVCNLYGNGDLPVTPFRTDDWKGVTADAK